MRRPSLGLVLAPGSLSRRLGIEGAVIYRVEPGGAAAAAGLAGLSRSLWGRWELGDIIQEIDGQAIRDEADLILALEERMAGDRVSLTYLREGRKRTAEAVLAEGS